MPPEASGTGAVSLANCLIEMRGDWHGPEAAARQVIERGRRVALGGLKLRSPRQPDALIVENKREGNPSIWLHTERPTAAWIKLDMTTAGAWCQLAYQLSHEFGHCLANSWQSDAKPRPPSQWLEEALAETLALRALGRLSESWQAEPVFADGSDYADAIRRYRSAIIARYNKEARDDGATDLSAWFQKEADGLRHATGLSGLAEDVVPALLGAIEADPALVEDYQAMNLWPERTSLPVSHYLTRWQQQCEAIGTRGRLPSLISRMRCPSEPTKQ